MILPAKEIIDDRMGVCISCDQVVDKSDDPMYVFTDIVGTLISDAPKKMCEACSCPIWVKARFVSNSCPLNKWAA